jgi:hypothetical protein
MEASSRDDSPLSIFRAAKSLCSPKKTRFLPLYQELKYRSQRAACEEKAVVTGYCVYEKKKNREIKSPKQIVLKNGRAAVKGICGSCGKPIFRIGKLK